MILLPSLSERILVTFSRKTHMETAKIGWFFVEIYTYSSFSKRGPSSGSMLFFLNGKLTKKATFHEFSTSRHPLRQKTQAILQEKLRLDREATKEVEARIPWWKHLLGGWAKTQELNVKLIATLPETNSILAPENVFFFKRKVSLPTTFIFRDVSFREGNNHTDRWLSNLWWAGYQLGPAHYICIQWITCGSCDWWLIFSSIFRDFPLQTLGKMWHI